jgi:TPP-dependent pyruvate/acetoin dehydrogenase alpha subunit
MSEIETLSDPSADGQSKAALIGLYERMLLIRRFEERVADLFAKGKLPGFVHLYIGQEAVAVGVCSVLRDEDFITSTHRGHGHTIAKGGDVSRMMAELYGRSTGYCKGKGGSMHITDMSVGMLGANGIVAGGIPIAVGAAYGAAKIRETDQVAVAFFGDGASNEGPFHEACNMAAAWSLPVVFACENNLYGVGTRLGRVSASEDVVARASAYGMPGVTVDGNDVVAVREAATEAVARARAGQGPTLLECKTWRHKGHFEGENPNYWDEDERQRWLTQDPIQKYATKLIDAGIVTQGELDELDGVIQGRIDAAVNFAETSPDPAPEDALVDVFA